MPGPQPRPSRTLRSYAAAPVAVRRRRTRARSASAGGCPCVGVRRPSGGRADSAGAAENQVERLVQPVERLAEAVESLCHNKPVSRGALSSLPVHCVEVRGLSLWLNPSATGAPDAPPTSPAGRGFPFRAALPGGRIRHRLRGWGDGSSGHGRGPLGWAWVRHPWPDAGLHPRQQAGETSPCAQP